jgi:drug/metabolite transporter (DMT)-like permease
MNQGYILLCAAAALTAGGQILFKKVAVLPKPLWTKFFHPMFLSGALFFGGAPVLSSLAARTVDYSIIYAMSSLSFPMVLFLSFWVLNERIDLRKIAGVCTIIAGLLVMVAGG